MVLSGIADGPKRLMLHWPKDESGEYSTSHRMLRLRAPRLDIADGDTERSVKPRQVCATITCSAIAGVAYEKDKIPGNVASEAKAHIRA